MKLIVSDTALEAVEGLGSVLKGYTKDTNLAHGYFDADLTSLWKELTSGGWHLLGTPEDRNGVGFDLMDLTTIATEWGKYLLPLPFIPTLLINRWSGAANDEAMLTYSVKADFEGDGVGLAPFGGLDGVSVVSNLDSGAAATTTGEVDDWAPSLPFLHASILTAGLSDEQVREIVILGAAELVGTGVTVLQIAAKYAHERTQFGKPIATYQGVQRLLADMQRDLEMARTAVVWAVNDSEKTLVAAKMAWERIRKMTENAIQVHGGYGFTWEAGIHFYSRHVTSWGDVLTACGMERWTP